MKLATDSWMNTFKMIGEHCLGIILALGVVITFPLWVISLGHIRLSSKFDKMMDNLLVKIDREIRGEK